MKKKLTSSQAFDRNILILVGEGKSTLTNWISCFCYCGVKEAIKNADNIKKISVDDGVVIQLEKEEDYKKLPLGIKRRAIMFKLEIK